MGMPKYTDDYGYMAFLRPWFERQGVFVPENGGNFFTAGFPWKEITDTWSSRWQTDNLRLGNMLVVFFLCLPKWVGAGLIWMSWVWAMFAAARYTDVDWRRSRAMLWAIIFWGFFMPWRNHLGSLDFMFNYLPPIALAMWLLLTISHGRGKENHRASLYLKIFIIALITSAWQEAVGVPLFAGFAIIAIFDRKLGRARWMWVVASVGLLLGIAYILASPGHSNRANTVFGGGIASYLNPQFLAYRFPRTVMQSLMYIIFAITAFCNRRHIRAYGSDSRRFLHFALVSGFMSCAMMFIFDTEARIGIWADFVAVVGIMSIIRNNGENNTRQSCRFMTYLGVALATLLCIHWAFVDYYAIKLRNSFVGGLHQYVKSKTGTVFVDVVDAENLPLICGNLPDVGAFTFGSYFICHDYAPDSSRPKLAFVPKELKDVTWDKAQPVAGNAEIKEYNGRYIRKYSEDYDNAWYWVTRGDRRDRLKTWNIPFYSDADGEQYTYIYFFDNRFNHLFHSIQSIDY